MTFLLIDAHPNYSQLSLDYSFEWSMIHENLILSLFRMQSTERSLPHGVFLRIKSRD
jgi:hypothetical protein